MTQESFILVIGVGGDKYSETELYLLPEDKVTPFLIKELETLKGNQWRDVYRDPCRCHRRKCFECEDWKKIKDEEGQKESRKAWILFNNIAVRYNTNNHLPGSISRIFSFDQ